MMIKNGEIKEGITPKEHTCAESDCNKTAEAGTIEGHTTTRLSDVVAFNKQEADKKKSCGCQHKH